MPPAAAPSSPRCAINSGLATYLEVLTNQTIQLNDERAAAALVARRIVASAQLQLALGGTWSTTQLPSN